MTDKDDYDPPAIPTAGAMLGKKGPPVVGEIGGRKVKLSRISGDDKAFICAHVEDAARAEVMREADRSPEHVFKACYDVFLRQKAEGMFKYNGEIVQGFLGTIPGVFLLASRLGGMTEAEVTKIVVVDDDLEETRRRALKLGQLLREVMVESFPPAPKAEAPAAGASAKTPI